MRKSARDVDGKFYRVYFNDCKLENVVEADEEEGWVEIVVEPCWKYEKLYGKVRLVDIRLAPMETL